uniref:Carboxyltransferase domain-containing protein n=1 Tax=Rhodopseudomonas palustris (strain BisA53) TaxID=316055 RepID=Q07M60_RHOP5
MVAPLSPPRILPSGDAALTVEFGRDIDDAANERVLTLDRAIAAASIEAIRESVPTYRSLLVHYDPEQTDFDALGAQLIALAQSPDHIAPSEARHWRIPVCYGGAHGIDLDAAAKTLELSTDELIRRHASGRYRVAMIGFTPGWSYLAGLDPALALPRRQNPRLETPAGTISIGGVQAGIQCLAGPSGWHLLGRTPVKTYQLNREPIFLLEPGDVISFVAIDAGQFDDMERAAAQGEPVAERIAP